MKDLAKTTFIFLRHGEPVGGKIFRGSTDDPLTEKGWLQMQQSVDGLKFDEIVSSPLKRCIEFSTHVTEGNAYPLTIMDEIQELHLGDWEGLSALEVEQQDAEALKQFWVAPESVTPPNGETFNDFEKRILLTWDSLNQKYVSDEQSKKILVVCHAGVMMVLLKKLLNIPVENILCIKLNYASKVRIEMHAKKYNLKPQIFIEHGYSFDE